MFDLRSGLRFSGRKFDLKSRDGNRCVSCTRIVSGGSADDVKLWVNVD